MSAVLITRLRDRAGPKESGANNGGPDPETTIDPGPILGDWVNYDQTTTGILRIEITAGGTGAAGGSGAVRARVLGSAVDGPQPWGPTDVAVFSAGVDARSAVGFAARCELEFAVVLLAAYLNKRLLVLDAYTVFTDGSGRANYFQRDHLYLPQTPHPPREVTP